MPTKFKNKNNGYLRCSKCGIEKSPRQFHVRKSVPCGRVSECRDCRHEKAVQVYESEKARLGISKRRYRERWLPNSCEHTDSEHHMHGMCLACYRDWRRFTPQQIDNHYSVVVYNNKGISVEERTWLFNLAAVCWLCGVARTLVVDHDHSHQWKHPSRTKNNRYFKSCKECIRGPLCNRCNRGVLPVLETHMNLQSERVQEYLALRPFVNFPQAGQYVEKYLTKEKQHENS